MPRVAAAVFLVTVGCGARTAPPSAAPAEPAGPSRADVVEAMNGVSSAVLACLEGLHGTVAISFEFISTGEASRASVRPTGRATDGGPETTIELDARTAACVAGAASAAHVRPFERDVFSVNYPFRAP